MEENYDLFRYLKIKRSTADQAEIGDLLVLNSTHYLIEDIMELKSRPPYRKFVLRNMEDSEAFNIYLDLPYKHEALLKTNRDEVKILD